jgi:hypothetical protein
MTTEDDVLLVAGDQIRKLVRDHLANEAPPNRLSIIDLTLRRATSSYEALDLLARHDYSIEALVLSRTLFEDVVTAYWVETHPNPAKVGARFGKHKTKALDVLISRHAPGTIKTQAVSQELASWMGEPIDPWRWWTGKRLEQLLNDVDARREDGDWRERVQKLRHTADAGS